MGQLDPDQADSDQVDADQIYVAAMWTQRQSQKFIVCT